MTKKRSLFKVHDPILQKDAYLFLAGAWIVWTLAQAAFLLLMDWTFAIESAGVGGRRLIIGFLLLSGFLMLLSVLGLNTLLGRVTGPIHRMKEDLEAARARGDRAVIHLRKDDYFQDLAESINAAVDEAGRAPNGRGDRI